MAALRIWVLEGLFRRSAVEVGVMGHLDYSTKRVAVDNAHILIKEVFRSLHTGQVSGQHETPAAILRSTNTYLTDLKMARLEGGDREVLLKVVGMGKAVWRYAKGLFAEGKKQSFQQNSDAVLDVYHALLASERAIEREVSPDTQAMIFGDMLYCIASALLEKQRKPFDKLLDTGRQIQDMLNGKVTDEVWANAEDALLKFQAMAMTKVEYWKKVDSYVKQEKERMEASG